MVDLRTLAAAVLGVALGLLFVASPGTIVRIHTAGRVPGDRHGRYGEDGISGGRDPDATADADATTDPDATADEGSRGDDGGVPTWWLRAVRAVGVALVLGGLYFGWTLV